MKRVAVYAGTFDPPTLGHLDVLSRVEPLFDKIYVVVAENHRKKTLFTPQQRVSLIEDSLKELKQFKSHIEVLSYAGLIVDFCKKQNAKVLIRGLRAISDFENELQMAAMNRRLMAGIETLHMMTDEKYLFVSSSLIKEVAMSGGALGGIVPKCVEKALKNIFKSSAEKKSK